MFEISIYSADTGNDDVIHSKRHQHKQWRHSQQRGNAVSKEMHVSFQRFIFSLLRLVKVL